MGGSCQPAQGGDQGCHQRQDRAMVGNHSRTNELGNGTDFRPNSQTSAGPGHSALPCDSNCSTASFTASSGPISNSSMFSRTAASKVSWVMRLADIFISCSWGGRYPPDRHSQTEKSSQEESFMEGEMITVSLAIT